jgi:hypothetical protein
MPAGTTPSRAADTLAALRATPASMQAGLAVTIEEWNRAVAGRARSPRPPASSGADRGPRPSAPSPARCAAHMGGASVDSRLAVLGPRRRAVRHPVRPRGELLGGGALSGNSFVGSG